MRMYDIIKRKRDGHELSDEEIKFFVDGFTRGEIPDYQASALLMAVFFRGMTERETATLTFCIANSGDRPKFDIKGIRADKHSTGGVGDKTSLIVIPIVASLGIKAAKMSGRGLGHTGGTIDKLESIKGFDVDLDGERFAAVVNEVGAAIVGQNAELAPADKLLYALRDVTATVDSIPLIASSIMGKKLATDDDCIVLDVKSGSGAFMKTLEDSKKLASLCVSIGKRAGKKISALITNMDAPLGTAIGNSLEVAEAIEVLNGKGPSDLAQLSIELSAEILRLCGKGDLSACRAMAEDAVRSGKALDAFAAMVEAQGGDKKVVYDTSLFKKAAYEKTVCAPSDGFITGADAEEYGIAALLLGAGRNKVGDAIDYSAGIKLLRKTGDLVEKGEPIAVLYSDKNDFEAAEKRLLSATSVGPDKPNLKPLVLDRVD